VEAAQVAIEELETQLILLDDAFQHRQIARDLDIVLLDALEPFGFEHLLPRGTLRESLAGIARADVVVLTRADLVTETDRQAIRRRVERFRPDCVWVQSSHRPQALLSSDGARLELVALRGQRIAAFCGIGNPAGFRHTLDQYGLEIAAWREFPDHHLYSRADVDALAAWAEQNQAAAAVCTCKDLVKLAVTQLGDLPLWAVSIEMELTHGKEQLEERLSALACAVQPA
jgi:tetraacyldisaccharide 4'-kinase